MSDSLEENEETSSIKILERIIEYYNIVDSSGMVILKNGGVIKVEENFDYLSTIWIMYKKAKYLNDREKMEELQIPVFSNGKLFMDLEQINILIKND